MIHQSLHFRKWTISLSIILICGGYHAKGHINHYIYYETVGYLTFVNFGNSESGYPTFENILDNIPPPPPFILVHNVCWLIDTLCKVLSWIIVQRLSLLFSQRGAPLIRRLQTVHSWINPLYNITSDKLDKLNPHLCACHVLHPTYVSLGKGLLEF